MIYSVSQAAQIAGKSRATINRAIAGGTLTAYRSGPGKPWTIDAAELARAFPGPARELLSEQRSELPRAADDQSMTATLAAKDELIGDLREVLADLRHRLDAADADRRQAHEQLGAALAQIRALTDQRSTAPAPAVASQPAPPAPRRSWWRWGRQ
jgi:hypothetical protein